MVVLSFHVIELCFGKAASAELTQLFYQTQSLTVAALTSEVILPLSAARLDCERITPYNKCIHISRAYKKLLAEAFLLKIQITKSKWIKWI